MAVKAISTYGTQLLYGASANALTELARIKDYPDLIGDPNLIDVTDLMDNQQTNIAGIKTSDLMTFTCNYTKDSLTSVNEKANTPGYYALRLNDGSGFTWEGSHDFGVPGHGVDEPVEFTINITNTTPVTFTETITAPTGV